MELLNQSAKSPACCTYAESSGPAASAIAELRGVYNARGWFGMSKVFIRFIENQSGATAIEYALIAAGIAVAISTSLTMVGCSLTNLFTNIADKLKAT